MEAFAITPQVIIALAMIVSLTLYAIMGGADYGGGVWDLLAFGPRAKQQRETIVKALSPIWEANHVWLILVIVLLFSCFPSAFYEISIALHIPLTLLLFGIVLRGSAFTFRAYDSRKDQVQKFWGRIFAISSTITPVLLGITLGAISNGKLVTKGSDFMSVYVNCWWQPFPVAVGFLALSLFAYLAAVYLTADAMDAEVQNDFRLRAIITSLASAAMAAIVYVLCKTEAPGIWEDLHTASPLHAITFVMASITLYCLFTKKFKYARFFAAGQVALVLWGWAVGQFPYLVRPHLTIDMAAANERTLYLVIAALVAGAFLLFPSFYYLLKIFKLGEKNANEKIDVK